MALNKGRGRCLETQRLQDAEKQGPPELGNRGQANGQRLKGFRMRGNRKPQMPATGGQATGQMLKGFRIDCDADTILLEVDQTGPACHTGRRSCFYRVVEGNQLVTDSEPLIDPATLYGK